MATEEEVKDNKDNKDPFADIRTLLYSQRPESREAEIRAEKNKAKATAFLQAFGTIADAFTLSRGGDVPKRDLNPYIMNNMQKADGMREQDRADKKGWENSLLNLQSQVARHNIKQQDWEKQKAREDEKIRNAQEFQEKITEKQVDNTIQLNNLAEDKQYKFAGYENDLAIEREKLAQAHRIELAKLNNVTRQTVAGINAASKGVTKTAKEEKPFMSVPAPSDPTQKINLNRDDAMRIWRLIKKNTMTDLKYPVKENGKEVEKSIRIPKYENSKYSDKEVMDIIREFFETYPDKALEYWSLVGTNGTNRTNGTVGTNGTNPYAPYNPWQTPRQMPQGQGPIDYRNPVNTTNGFFKK